MQRQPRPDNEVLEVAEGPEVATNALIVQPLRHAAEGLVRHLVRFGHEAELVRPGVVVVQALRLLAAGSGDLPALAPGAS